MTRSYLRSKGAEKCSLSLTFHYLSRRFHRTSFWDQWQILFWYHSEYWDTCWYSFIIHMKLLLITSWTQLAMYRDRETSSSPSHDRLHYSNDWCSLDQSSDIFTYRWVYFNCRNSQFEGLHVVSIRKASLVLRIIPSILEGELSCWHQSSDQVKVLYTPKLHSILFLVFASIFFIARLSKQMNGILIIIARSTERESILSQWDSRWTRS
jgi:hypothetical protein